MKASPISKVIKFKPGKGIKDSCRARDAIVYSISEETAEELKSEFGSASDPLEEIMAWPLQEGKMSHVFSEGRNSERGIRNKLSLPPLYVKAECH